MLVAADVLSWAAVMAIPGPDIVAIGSQVARYGRRAGFATALGAAIGVAIWSFLSLIGISALFLAVPALAVVLPVLGSAVLILLGLLALKGAARPAGGGEVRYADEAPAPAAATASAWQSMRLGLVTNLSNPKALVFFTSFFTPLMNHYDGAAAKAAMLALLLAVSLLIFSTMSVLLKAASSSPLANLPAVRFLPGVIFVLIGAYYLADALGA